MSSIFEDLGYAESEEFDREFQKGSVRKGVCELDDGYYTGFIDYFGVVLSEAGNPMLKTTLVILSPDEFRGFLAIKWARIDLDDKPKTVRRIKSDLVTLGFEWEGLRSLEDEDKCAELLGLKIAFKVTHRKNPKPEDDSRRVISRFQNIWINRVVGRMTANEMQKYR
jgi:hypothetical protein